VPNGGCCTSIFAKLDLPPDEDDNLTGAGYESRRPALPEALTGELTAEAASR
jgi:hypothetical protein